MISRTETTSIMLSQSLAFQIFIAPAISLIRTIPIRSQFPFVHLQYVDAGYVDAGYTVL